MNVIPLLIVASHGDVAKAALRTATQILGAIEPSEAIGLESDGRLEDLEKGIRAARGKHGRTLPCIILVDLFGGSCSNVASKLVRTLEPDDGPVRVIAGFNVPMIIEFAFSRGKYDFDALADKVMEAGKKACIDVNAKIHAPHRPAAA